MALLRKSSGRIAVIVLLLLAGWGLRVLSGAAPPPGQSVGASASSLSTSSSSAHWEVEVLSGSAALSSQSVWANAGLPQFVPVGVTVRLDASLSTSPTGAPLQYQWSFLNVPNGSSAVLNSPAAVNPTFVVDQAGSYVLQLNVSDGVTSSSSQVVISTQATPPAANAGPNQFVSAGSVVHLDAGASTDPDGDSLGFQWSLATAPPGSQASISNPTAVATTFFADVPGAYVAQVTVSDTHGNNSISTVTISTQNVAPIASAGRAQSVTLGHTVQLDGSASTDPNGDQLSYSWSILSKPAASAASLSSPTTAKPAFVVDVAGSYVAQLAVSDSNGNVSFSTVEITTDAIPPTANAGGDQTVNVGGSVQLNGIGSVGTGSLQYQWNLMAKPSGSNAALSGSRSSSSSFIADQAGQYLIQLQVSDGVFTSAPTTLLVTAATAGPNLVLSPSPVNFGAQAVGATSNPVGVTITNLGTTSVQVTSFLLVGSNGSEFTTRGLNSVTLAPNTAFIFSVVFTPQGQGTRSAALIINDNSGGPAHFITLSGVGGASTPNFSLNPASLTFAGQAVGTTSASLPLTITNTGNAPLQITGMGFSGSNAGDFGFASAFTAPTAGSPITVAANGGSTSIPVVFNPAALGSRAATLLITDNAPNSPQAVPLSGTGISGQSGTISVTPPSIAFADQAVGSSSAPSPVTVTNSGTAAVQITSLAFSGANGGDFSTTAIAPVTVLANGGTAAIPVTFTPTAAGSRAASLAIADNSGGSAHTVALSGNGISAPPGILVSPSALNFQNQALNTTASLPLTVSNTGGAAVSVTGMLLAGANSGDFNISGSRSFTLLPGGNASVNVLFTPLALGSRTATIIIFDNSGGAAHAVTLSGIGGNSSPAIQLSPSSLSFPNQAVGTTSAPQPVTASNTGSAALQITGLGFGGSNPADFGFPATFILPTSAAPITVAANGGATSLPVVFKPTASGTRSASLIVTDNASGSPHSVALNGTSGQTGAISVTPASLAFPDQAVNGSSTPLPVTVTNAGTTAVQITALALSGANSGDFSTTATAPITVAANGGTAAIPVTFTPSAAGARSASLTITDNSGGSTHTVALSGNGITTDTGVSVSPASLNFQNQGLNVTASLPVVVSNNTSATVSVTGMLLAGLNSSDFNVSGSRSFTLLPETNFTVNLLFTPQAQGARTATLIITNTSGTGLAVSLSGTGVVAAPDISLSPNPLSFAAQAVGASATLPLTVTNPGNAPLQITGLAFSGSNPGDFGLPAGVSVPTPAAPITVAANGGATIIPMVFKPTASGQRAATLLITDNASGSPHAVALGGTATAPTVVLSPNPLTFGNQNLNTTSAPSSVTVTNTGNGALQITGLAFAGAYAGDFALPGGFTPATQNSPITVAANGGTAAIPVVFTPTASGPRTATLQFTDNASGSPQSLSVSGNGVGPTIVFNPSLINFASQMQSVASAVVPFTVSNTGNADLQITGISIAGANAADFSFPSGFTAPTPASPLVVAAGGVQNLGVIFTPSATGNRTATLNFADNAPNSPQGLALTGNGILPIAALSPNPVSFPSQATGSPSAPVVVTVTNSGTAPLTITSFSFTGANASDFSTSTAPMTVSPNGGTGNIAVIFTPSAVGARTATLQVNDNAIPNQQTATLNGTGVGAPTFTAIPPSLNFGTQQDNVPSTALPLTISNTGTANLVINSLTMVGANATDFSYSLVGGGVFPQTIAQGGNLALNVIFTPATGGSRTASLIFTDNASGSPQTVGLSGTGTATPPTATFSAGTLTFNPQPVNTTSAPLTVTITNTGQTDLSVSSVSFSGTNASEFQVTPPGPFTVAKNGGVTTLSVTFTPTAQGARAATMSIADNAPNSPQTVSVSGTGRGQGQISLAPLSLGGNLQTLATGSLDVAPTSPLPVTITSSDTSKVLLVPLATDPTGVTQGTGQITGTVPAGQGRLGFGFPGFWVQALASSGTAQITITAPGYLSGSATVTLTPSGFVLNSPNGPGANFTATLGANSSLTVGPVQLDASGNVLSTSQPLRGGAIANVTVSSGTTAIGTVSGNPAVVQPGAAASSIVTFQPKAAGTTLLSMAEPGGYSAPITGTQLTATVIAPTITLNPILVGFDQQALGIGRLTQAPAKPLNVTITSSDSTKVLLSTNPTTVGSSSIGLQIAAGATTLTFYVQALASSGPVTLTASASGYSSGTGNVGLLGSAFVFGTANGVAGNFSTTTISPATGLTVALWQLDSSSRPLSPAQLRPGSSASVAVGSGTPSTGTITGSPALFNSGDSSNSNLAFQPAQSCNAPCTTVLSVTQPAGFSTPASGGQLTVTVNQPSLSLLMVTPTVGGNLEAPGAGSLDAPAPSNLPVTITSDNPNVLLSNCQQILGCTGTAATDVGSQSILVVVPLGNGVNSVGFPNYYVQALANSGTATLTASAPGFNPGFITVTLAPAALVISGPNGYGGNFGAQLGNGAASLTLSAVVLDANLVPTQIPPQAVRGGFSASVAVTSDSPAAVVVGSPVSVSAGSSSVPVVLQLEATGVADISVATPSGFTTPSSGNQLSITIN